jgi:hypothetical protein
MRVPSYGQPTLTSLPGHPVILTSPQAELDAWRADLRENLPAMTSRLLDFIGERELTAQIGHQANMWPLPPSLWPRLQSLPTMG